MVNLHEIDLTIKDIEASPESHNQMWWGMRTPCGTTMCAAGFAVARHGWSLVFVPSIATGGESATCCRRGDVVRPVELVAREILDLDAHRANQFFSARNKIEDLKHYRDMYALEA